MDAVTRGSLAIDTHIHLFRERDLSSLAWMTDDNPLHGEHSLHDWAAATEWNPSNRKPLGFVFLETDRKRSLDPEDFSKPVEEFKFLYDAGTGMDPAYKSVSHLVLGIVPWCPLPLGPDALDRYLHILQEHMEGSKVTRPELLKGFRYLLQWAAPGEILHDGYVEGLKWIGRNNLLFEMTLDCRSNGVWQLFEAVELLRRAGNDRGAVILDHLAKPDLRVKPSELAEAESFIKWKTGIQMFAACGETYIKLSGAFSELDPQLVARGLELSGDERSKWLQELVLSVKPWISAALDAFGPEKVLWGSDWPVCTITAGKNKAWGLWAEVVERCLDGVLQARDKERVWWENAARVYGIDVGNTKSRM